MLILLHKFVNVEALFMLNWDASSRTTKQKKNPLTLKMSYELMYQYKSITFIICKNNNDDNFIYRGLFSHLHWLDGLNTNSEKLTPFAKVEHIFQQNLGFLFLHVADKPAFMF